jgi:hypothetical protein
VDKVVGYDCHCDHYQLADFQTVDTGIDVDRMETKYVYAKETRFVDPLKIIIKWKCTYAGNQTCIAHNSCMLESVFVHKETREVGNQYTILHTC